MYTKDVVKRIRKHHASYIEGIFHTETRSRCTQVTYFDFTSMHDGQLLLRSHQKIALASRVVVSVVLSVKVRVRFVPQGPLDALFEATRKEGVHEVGR